MATTLTLTGATDLTVTGLVEGPPGVFSLPPISLSTMDFIASPAPVSQTLFTGSTGGILDPTASVQAMLAATWS